MTVSNQVFREEIQVLTFTIDGVSYGVNVNQVREVKNFEGVTPVPYAPSYVKGVTNLRGEVIPVIDLRKQLGILSQRSSQDEGIMVITQNKPPVGVMVDAVKEVLTLSKGEVEANPANLSTTNSDAVLGVAKYDNSLIILLDLTKIVNSK